MSLRAWTALSVALAIGLAGCASEIRHTSAVLSTPAGGERTRIEVAGETTLELSSGYRRVLPAGSVWELHGTLPQGGVYRRLNDVFTVEGAHVHEAYLVVSGNDLVGYYLPAERAFSPAKRVPLNLK